MSVSRANVVAHLDRLLDIHGMPDDSANGLQFEGTEEITKVALAVDGSKQTFEQAVASGCQMVIVHHGFIWGGLKSISGRIRNLIQYLVEHNLNVYAAHLPLDAHAELGNNIVLAQMLGLADVYEFGQYKGKTIGFAGTLPEELSAEEISTKLQGQLGGTSQILPFGKEKNRKVAIISGGGSAGIHEAIPTGVDCFITGESSQWNHHEALEGSLNVIYLGHYHSETVGVKAVGEHLVSEFGLETTFIDIPTLV